MDGFGPDAFGRLYASDYDAALGTRMDQQTSDSVEFLARLANGGRALELAIGTGRVAIPLAARGVEVHGIEASQEMVDEMRKKPGGEALPVTVGDMAEAGAEGLFDVVFLVFNTVFNLTSQEAQVRCFANAARHLKEGGVFVVETVLPEIFDIHGGQRVKGRYATSDTAGFEICTQDPVNQTVSFQRIHVTEQGTTLSPLFQRYVWPSEMDLMARLAGMSLQGRFDWWDRRPFTAASKQHVSVWQR